MAQELQKSVSKGATKPKYENAEKKVEQNIV